MTINTAKRRMLDGNPAFGAEVSLGSALSAELIAPLGFDFILVDNQHGAWDDNGSMGAFRAIWMGGAMPMARVRRNEFGAIGRLLDRGAMGIVVPMVNTVEEAKAAADAVRYPPLGGRSGGAFGAGFLGGDYMQWAKRRNLPSRPNRNRRRRPYRRTNPSRRRHRRLLDRPRRPQYVNGRRPQRPRRLASPRRPHRPNIRRRQARPQNPRHLDPQRLRGIAPRLPRRPLPNRRRRRPLGHRRRPPNPNRTGAIAPSPFYWQQACGL